MGVTLLGFAAGASYRVLEQWLGRATTVLTVLVLAVVAFVWWGHRRRAAEDG